MACPVDCDLAGRDVEAHRWAEPHLHKETGAQDRVRHPAASQVLFHGALGVAGREIQIHVGRDGGVDEVMHAAGPGCVDQVQHALMVGSGNVVLTRLVSKGHG